MLGTLLLTPVQAQAQQLDKLQGLCTRGGQVINTAGSASSQTPHLVVPSCTVTIYVAGTTTLASIYSDRSGTPTPKANPFTANTQGEWWFYAAVGRYDIRLSGGTGPGAYPAPVTYGDFWIANGSGSGVLTQAYTTIKQDDSARTQRFVLEVPSSSGHATTDSVPKLATVLSSPRIPTGVFNLVEQFSASGIPNEATGSISSGSSTLTMVSFPSGFTMATYWKVGQGILVAGAGSAGADLITTVSAVGTTTLTLASSASTTANNTRVQHDDTAALQAAVNNTTNGNTTVYLPEGGFLVTSPISIPALTEGKSLRLVGAGGKSGSTIFYQGLGSLFVQASSTANLDSFEVLDLSLATSTPGAYSTVRPTVNQGSAFDFSYGQFATVNFPKWTNLRIIGWGRFGIFCANCQGGWISNVVFRQNATAGVALVAPETLQQSGAAEPNINSIRDSQFDLAPNISSSDVSLSNLSMLNGSYQLTATSGSPFTSSHVGRYIIVVGAGVLGGDLRTIIKSVDSSTQVTLAAKNQTGGNLSSLTGTISKPTLASVFLHRANNTGLSNLTIQGNYSGSTQAEYGILIDRSYSVRANNLWIEDTGGGGGEDIHVVNSSHNLVITGYKSNADPTASTGNTHGGNIYLRTSKGAYVSGMTAQNPTKHFDLDNQSSLVIESSQLSSPDNTFNTYDQSRDRLTLGEGVTYFTGIATGDAQRGTQTQYDDPMVQLVANPRFEDGTGGMTSWTDTNPTYHVLVNSGSGRYQRYQQINTSALGDSSSYNVAFQQVVSIPDNYPSRPWTLSYDLYIESFGSVPTTGRNVGVDVVASGSGVGYDDFKVQSLNTSNLTTGRWERINYVVYLPSGTSRTFTIRVRTTQGPNTPIIRVANFRLSPGKHNSGSSDEIISALAGGTIRATSGLKFRETSGTAGATVALAAPASISSSFTLKLPTALPGSSQCLQSDTSGNLSFTTCGGSGSGTNIRQALNAKLDYACTGDGVANDTACISNMITAASASNKKILYFPGGTYLTDTITQSLQGLTFEGDGELLTVIKARTANTPVFNVTGPGQTLNLTFRNLGIQGQGKTSGSGGHCLQLGSATSGNEAAFFTMRNVTVSNCGGKGVYMAGQFNSLFEAVTTDEIGDHHFDIQGGNSTSFIRCYVRTIEANKVGYRIRSGSATLIGNNGMDPDSASSAIWGVFGQESALDGADSYFRGTLLGNNIESFGSEGLEFRSDSYATFDGNIFITSTSGNHIAVKFNYVDPTHQGTWNGNNRLTLAGGAWSNSQPIHSRNAPFLLNADTTFTQFYNFFDTTTYDLPQAKAALDPGQTSWLYQFKQLGVGKYLQFTGVTTPGVSGTSNCRIYADSGTNTLKYSCNGAAYADIGVATSVALTSTRVAFGSGTNLLTESSDLTFNNTTKQLTINNNASGSGVVNIQGVGSDTRVNITNASAPGTQGGLVMPFSGGGASFGPGIWWCSSASYGSCSGLKLNLGLVWQAPSSTHSSVKLAASTGTSTDGTTRIELQPDNGFVALYPYGTSAGNTGEFRTYELAANGTNYAGFKAGDSLATNLIWKLPTADGTSGQCLQTDASLGLSFANCGSSQYSTSTGTGAQTIDWAGTGTATTRQFTVSSNASVTFTFSNAHSGQLCNLIFIRDATGSAAVNWPATVKWPGATPITPTAGAAKKDVYQFIFDGTNYLLLGYSADVQ